MLETGEFAGGATAGGNDLECSRYRNTFPRARARLSSDRMTEDEAAGEEPPKRQLEKASKEEATGVRVVGRAEEDSGISERRRKV